MRSSSDVTTSRNERLACKCTHATTTTTIESTNIVIVLRCSRDRDCRRLQRNEAERKKRRKEEALEEVTGGPRNSASDGENPGFVSSRREKKKGDIEYEGEKTDIRDI
jgi:hypothetical protein